MSKSNTGPKGAVSSTKAAAAAQTPPKSPLSTASQTVKSSKVSSDKNVVTKVSPKTPGKKDKSVRQTLKQPPPSSRQVTARGAKPQKGTPASRRLNEPAQKTSFFSLKSKQKSTQRRRLSRTKGMNEEHQVQGLAYYHYRLHRVDAQPMLRRNGDFILRRMRQQGKEAFAVSVRWGESVKHIPIISEEDRFCFEDRAFRHISDLINHHVTGGIPLTYASGARIERPKIRQPWELLTKDVSTGKVIGKGNFGQVYESTWTRAKGDVMTVAVKTLDKILRLEDDAAEQARVEMLEEARIMRAVSGQPNVIMAYGVTVDTEHPMAVMQLVKGGSLEKLLRRKNVPTDIKIRLSSEACKGVSGIHRAGYVHRDIAARNCLVDEVNGSVGNLLITDFGMTRFVGDAKVYKVDKAGQMPVVWCAIESLKDLIWRPASDVWSLAVLIWEIFTDGAQPYNYLDPDQTSRAGMIKYLDAGNRLELPKEVPAQMVPLLNSCWHKDYAKRPDPAEMADKLKTLSTCVAKSK